MTRIPAKIHPSEHTTGDEQSFIFDGLSAVAHAFLADLIRHGGELRHGEVEFLRQHEKSNQLLDELITHQLVVLSDTTWQVTEKAKNGIDSFFGQMAFWERMITASKGMTYEERMALHAWERDNLGKGDLGTSDWPGWTAVYSRLSQ